MEKYVVYDIFVHFMDDGESIKKETNSWIRFVHSKEEGINLPIKFGDLYFKNQVQYHIDINNLNLTEEGRRKLILGLEMQNVVSTTPDKEIYVYQRLIYKLDEYDQSFELPADNEYYRLV